ncbi:MAG TPA: metallophosphoesterase family protein [Herpetosiphonaceae bacterium]
MASIILHLSDIHAGPPFNPEKARLVLEEAWRIKPTLVVLSGDLVQRADYRDQWLSARDFIAQLPQPTVAVMGNHDVPMHNPLARIFQPHRAFQRYISPILAPVWSNDDLVVAGVNTARSFVKDGGALSDRQLADLEATLDRYPDELCKIVIMHHHPVMPPGETRSVVRNAAAARRTFDRARVELVLCGHTHASYIGNTLEFDPDLAQGTVIVQAGTATSRRGRRWYRGKNAFNVLAIEAERTVVTQHLYLEDAGRFMPVSQHRFPRRSAGAYALPIEERAEVVAEEQTAGESQRADRKIEQVAQEIGPAHTVDS